ncbi:hypothetical protein PoB_005619900 [Plakobranchus ocellatus]|uniref:Uncharacterized protein n=1 Tax=Plakobranchus ocellatus TaxID=259542 RepID=A0AAV4CEW8_9GAST|nr:hypothetical protein PoB_005619900 [Plakobranchus ocellatus]
MTSLTRNLRQAFVRFLLLHPSKRQNNCRKFQINHFIANNAQHFGSGTLPQVLCKILVSDELKLEGLLKYRCFSSNDTYPMPPQPSASPIRFTLCLHSPAPHLQDLPYASTAQRLTYKIYPMPPQPSASPIRFTLCLHSPAPHR